ncbi:Hairy/enhancer-of-split with YRPW motif protein 2 [Cladophialophora chaetospira]|uniref:Sugar phosphate phosphatase n=1 Tax=Cladophialophora chaetospira TaxID=386627 RepID=A0AA38XEP8_9EURO|nr:Hairy/enhancer-of-split with YRPW motif protein 2 [Cladophialophora chaetospira]
MEYDPKVPTYQTSDPTSFAHKSARERWPAIITGAIDDVHRTVSRISDADKDALAEGKAITSSLSTLKYELQHNRVLSPITDDGAPDVKLYNDELQARGPPTWHAVEWLYAECYLYRRIGTLFSTAKTKFWKGYDPFYRQKMKTFKSSRPAVIELCARYRDIITQIRSSTSGAPVANDVTDEKEIEQAEMLLFVEMAEICLWGNATDLSLLTSLSYEDIQKLQGSGARKESEKNILVNDLDRAFEVLTRAQKAKAESRRVDIVLDNAGFELFVDLLLAGYLVATGLATEVVLHPKDIPWFVSDVVPKDFSALLSAMADPKAFYETISDADDDPSASEKPPPLSDEEAANVQFLFDDLSHLHSEGKLVLRPNRFWTHAGSFWRMPSVAPDLVDDLKESSLVIFKGDLNYRKLAGDAAWPASTPFAEAIGPLGPSSGLRVLALRTCKADVVVGLPEGKDEEIRATDGGGGDSGARKWAWSGKWAVVQFSDGKS